MAVTTLKQKWQFWIDRGGTFTDIVARKPSGLIQTHKLLSENPKQYQDAAIHGMKEMLGINVEEDLPRDQISVVKMGTTLATNALLERKGEDTLLVITKGFKDQLRIGYQTRPDLFALHIELPELLYSEVLEIEERIGAQGKILVPLNEDAAREGLIKHYRKGLRSIAIVLMHGYRYHVHENQLVVLAKEIGFTQISVSHEISPLIKLVSRGDTTVIDAYLSPVLRRYVNQIASQLQETSEQPNNLMFMKSNGGLADAKLFQGKDAILSGPTGGVVGMAKVCELAGFKKVIGFDMGGTSTDVSHYNGEFDKVFETQVAGIRIQAPMMLINTIAAGGGSVLKFLDQRYQVGPESASAYPGPACYRNDGPLTITDCNVMMGKLQPTLFPSVFGANANKALDNEVVKAKFQKLSNRIEKETGNKRTPEAVATGYLKIAVENMANAIKKISIMRGYDVTEYTLCCFGGAGGQHACLVADALSMKQILIHPYASVLSAYGIGLADIIVDRQQSIGQVLNASLLEKLKILFKQLQQEGMDELERQSVEHINTTFKNYLRLRYEGSDTVLTVTHDALDKVISQFEQTHQKRFGFISSEQDIVVEAIQVEVISQTSQPINVEKLNSEILRSHSDVKHDCYINDQWQTTPFYHRDSLVVNKVINGPAVVYDSTNTIVIEPGWRSKLTAENNLLLERYMERKTANAVGTDVDPVMLEIFNNLFMSVAEQMGTVLENTAVSVNIKERLDFSCAIFDPLGNLVANAPHVPVHLGSMSESIKSVIRDFNKNISSGDAFILNTPYNGGTHLPDITVIKPVFSDRAELLFYVASRGHHTDIGGTTPGSAPAHSVSIEEEGIVFDAFKIVENNLFHEEKIYSLLTNNRWPARNPSMNISDIKAQLAACEKGAEELNKTVKHYSEKTVHAYMQHVQNNAEESVRKTLSVLKDGSFEYKMDDDNHIVVSIKVDQKNRKAIIDFTGTSSQHHGNFNAPTAVVKAAVLYVFRCLVGDNIPLNDGCLKPFEIIIPKPSMINPEYPAAVFAGNVETSQFIVDALFGALGVIASSQGTMNNFVWGNERYQYYETLCGGTGAAKNSDGTDAVHSHMTNSKLTDPEVLEWRFPVILNSFEIKLGSGGAGKFRGGDGVIRKMQFLEEVTANIISSHRKVPPYGLAGGENAQVGKNRVEHTDGTVTELSGIDQIELQQGDIFIIETPGGGGYGSINNNE